MLALYSPGYLERLIKRGYHVGLYWAATFCFVIAMSEAILSANAICFLLFWEIMSIATAALLLSRHQQLKSRKASLIYMSAAALSTAFMVGGFLWFYFCTASWYFADWHISTQPTLLAAATMIFLGAAVKAGLWPFHIWIPHVYAEAPATVAVLMSGVKINVAIYIMIRILIMQHCSNAVLGFTLIALGTVSALWGILFALIQTDLKKLLAYSSLENVGLMVLGIGVCIVSVGNGLPVVAAVALTATILHALNHSAFKSLLFFNAGSIETAAGSETI